MPYQWVSDKKVLRTVLIASRNAAKRLPSGFYDSDDLAQDVLLKLAKSPFKADNGTSLCTYVTTIINRTIIDKLRKQSHQDKYYSQIIATLQPEQDPEVSDTVADKSAMVSQVIDYHRRRGTSLGNLSLLLGLPRNTILQYHQRKRKPCAERAARICAVLNENRK